MFIFRKGNRVRVVLSKNNGFVIKGNRVSIRVESWTDVEQILKDWTV